MHSDASKMIMYMCLYKKLHNLNAIVSLVLAAAFRFNRHPNLNKNEFTKIFTLFIICTHQKFVRVKKVKYNAASKHLEW